MGAAGILRGVIAIKFGSLMQLGMQAAGSRPPQRGDKKAHRPASLIQIRLTVLLPGVMTLDLRQRETCLERDAVAHQGSTIHCVGVRATLSTFAEQAGQSSGKKRAATA